MKPEDAQSVAPLLCPEAVEALLDWPFWLAHYTQDWEATTFRYHFAMWQYTSQGTVDGIPTPVDLDLCMMEFPVQTPEEEGPHA